ncbi:unnamed protein product [Ambrosiozyma monospora]|uniref:Unnamed protein product n=1 Tax=Ambrosiozyma monospora TaxID=43982 RepID=A0ACB5TPF0_AMBMO|nr:unnamed protein product [Ambrosiozyma monospora]
MSLQSIKFNEKNATLSILNQLLVPYQTVYLDITSMAPPLDQDQDQESTHFSGYDAIKGMYTRGAPAIMLVGVFSIIVELNSVINENKNKWQYNLTDIPIFKKQLIQRIDKLITSRPTAVNLLNGCNEVKQIITNFKGTDLQILYKQLLQFSVQLYKDDLESNLKIGANGVDYIYKSLAEEGFKGDFSVMTICNTGSLATSGHGTALGIIRSLHERSKATTSKSQQSDADADQFKLSHVQYGFILN